MHTLAYEISVDFPKTPVETDSTLQGWIFSDTIFIGSYFVIIDLTFLDPPQKDSSTCAMMAQRAEFVGDTESLGVVSHLYVQTKASVMSLP